MDRTDCFEVRTDRNGGSATFTRFAFRAGETLYTLRGTPCAERTRYTFEIGPDEHLEDGYAQYINHSFQPNIEVRGRELVALTAIEVGDEITFDYLANESAIASPFVCYETGRRVDTDGCRR